MRITCQKKVKEYLDNGFKLEKLNQHKRTLYYLTNYKDCEITVPENTINKMIENKIIDWQLDYRTNTEKHNIEPFK